MTTDAFYIESSVPAGLTLAQYRCLRPKRRTLWERLTNADR
jgi:hypothetical protein